MVATTSDRLQKTCSWDSNVLTAMAAAQSGTVA
jgi:hypothetical protein